MKQNAIYKPIMHLFIVTGHNVVKKREKRIAAKWPKNFTTRPFVDLNLGVQNHLGIFFKNYNEQKYSLLNSA